MSSSVSPFYNLEFPRRQGLGNFWVPATLGTRLDTRDIVWVLGFYPSAPMLFGGRGITWAGDRWYRGCHPHTLAVLFIRIHVA